MTSNERVQAALRGGRPDRIPFAEHQIDQTVLNAMFGQEHATDPIFVAEALGLDVLTFTLMPPLFVEESVLADGRRHQTGDNARYHRSMGL